MADNRKTVLITGCSEGGIGHALALAFHSRGFRVFATARNLTKMRSLTAQNIETIELNVVKPLSISDLKANVAKRTNGRLDILINNAGRWLESPALETDISAIKETFEVNVFGPMEMIRQFTPLLLPTHGIVVNIGSILGIMPYPITSAYNGSKAALAQYSDTLRLELEPLGIKVLTVVTGQVATNLPQIPELSETSIYQPLKPALTERAREHIEKSMSSEAYASALVKQIVDHPSQHHFWKGTNSTITWLVSTFGPRNAFDFLMKKTSGIANAQAEIFERASSSI